MSWRCRRAIGTERSGVNCFYVAVRRRLSRRSPRDAQYATEVFAERQLADPKSDLVMTNGLVRRVVEGEVAEVRMRIQATEIGRAEFHQDRVGSASVASGLELVRVSDRVRIGIVGVRARERLRIPAGDRAR